MKPGETDNTDTEVVQQPQPTAEEKQAAALFDAAVEHVQGSPSVPFTQEAADAAIAEGEGDDKQPRDEKGKFAKADAEGETDEQRAAREAAEKTAADKAAAEKTAADAAAAAAAKAKAEAADPNAELLAALPEDARAVVAKIQADAKKAVEEAELKAKRHTSQVDGYKKALAEARAEADRAKKAGDPAAEKKAKEEAAAANEALENLKKDFPNIATALDAVAKTTEERVRKELGAQIAALQQQVAPVVQRAHDSAVAAEEAAIEEKHEGWKDEIKTSQFIEWYKAQPAEVQALAKGNAQAEIRMFDLYRVDHPRETAEQIAAREKAAADRAAADALAAKRQQQQRDAAGPSGKRTPAPTKTPTDENSADAMFDAAVAKVAKEFRVSP